MTTRISPHEGELLSAYLDNQLTPKERVRLEEHLRNNVRLNSALIELRRTRAVLRNQPHLRSPRNFILTPQMVGRPVARKPSSFARFASPALGIASALAVVLFALVVIGDFLTLPRTSTAMQSLEKPIARGATPQAAAPALAIPGAAPTALPAEAYPKSAPAPLPENPTSPAADTLAMGAGAPTQFESTATETLVPTMIEVESMHNLAQTEKVETAQANSPTPPPPPFTLGKSISVSPTATETPSLTPTLTPTPSPTETETPEPTPEPSSTPTLEPTSTPTASPSPLPAVAAVQEQPLPTALAPASSMEEQLPRTTNRTILRVVEVLIAGFAVLAGLAAIFLRRVGRG